MIQQSHYWAYTLRKSYEDGGLELCCHKPKNTWGHQKLRKLFPEEEEGVRYSFYKEHGPYDTLILNF